MYEQSIRKFQHLSFEIIASKLSHILSNMKVTLEFLPWVLFHLGIVLLNWYCKLLYRGFNDTFFCKCWKLWNILIL